MSRFIASLALGLAATAASLPAEAGDFNNGAKPYQVPGRHGGAMVPAPVPIYDTFNWYLRADFGAGFGNRPDVSESGMRYGATDSIAPFGMSSAWFNPDFDTFLTAGVGVGYYLSPRWRMDATYDWRSEARIKADGAYSYAQYTLPPAAVPAALTGMRVDGNAQENITVRSSVALLNFYYDLADRSRFTPYVGLGVGAVFWDVHRKHFTSENVVDPATGTVVGTRSYSGGERGLRPAFAAQMTLGASYTLWTSTILDFNYRLMYLGSTEAPMQISGSAAGLGSYGSRLDISSSFEHQLRAGLRWNIW